MFKNLLSVGEVAQRAGVAVSTLHFYERKGLIQSLRNSGNQRRFERSVLRRVAVIQVAQSVGLSLEEIGAAMKDLPTDHAPGVADWEAMSRHWHAALDARIIRMERLRDGLANCIGCGCLSVDTCPLRNPADSLGRQGKTGARILLGD
ncbi:redox-sensitive transcriptional activator SoxR [Devosia sp. CAU 1758]